MRGKGSTRKSKNATPSATFILLFLIGLVVFFTIIFVPTFILAPRAGNGGDNIPTSAPPPPLDPECDLVPPVFVNPTFESVQPITTSNVFSRPCVAYNSRNNSLYIWGGTRSGSYSLRVYNLDEYNATSGSTMTEGPNLIPTGIYDNGMRSVLSCMYDDLEELFLVIDASSNLYEVDFDGNSILRGSASAIGSAGGGITKDGERNFYALSQSPFVLHRFDSTDGSILETIPLNVEQSEPRAIRSYGLTYNLTSNHFVVQRFGIYVGISPQIDSIDRSTFTYKYGCQQDNPMIDMGDIDYDSQGRLWGASGETLLVMNSAPAGVIPSNSSLPNLMSFDQCDASPMSVLSSQNYSSVANDIIFNGTGCCDNRVLICDSGASNIFTVVDSANDPDIGKRSQSLSLLSTLVEESMESTIADSCVYNISANATMTMEELEAEFEANSERSISVPPPPTIIFFGGSSTNIIAVPAGWTQNPTRHQAVIASSSAPISIMTLDDGSSLSLTAVPGGSGPFQNLLTLTNLAPLGPCQSATMTDYSLRVDDRVQRWVALWVSGSRDRLCVVVSDTDSFSGSWSFFEFTFSGQEMHDLTFSVWKEYYNVCWENRLGASAALRYGQCHVLERDRMLNGGGAPRSISVPPINAIALDGQPVVVTPTHRPVNNFDTGALAANAFPCGIFAGMSSVSNGVFDLRLCQSVDFDTSMITTLHSRTPIGEYDDGSSGVCAAIDRCVPTSTTHFMDPQRYSVFTAYRNFGNVDGSERIAASIIVDADGMKNSKVRWGEFSIQPDGSLIPYGEGMYVMDFHPGNFSTGRHAFNTDLVYTPNGFLFIMYSPARAEDTGYYFPRIIGRPIGYNPGFLMESTTRRFWSQDLSINRADVPLRFTNTPRGMITQIPNQGLSLDIVESLARVASPFTHTSIDIRYNDEFTQSLSRVAIDQCGHTARCIQTFQQSPFNGTIASP